MVKPQFLKNIEMEFKRRSRQKRHGSVTTSRNGDDLLRQKSRSRSVGGSPLESPRTSKLVNQGGNITQGNRCQRQRSLRRTEDEVKKSRSQSVAYELSQDLQEKQVEMLERKYGGSIRSRRAAKTIQRAFRQYCMNRNFEKLRIAVGERRLSKRLSELGRSNTIWTDRISADSHYNSSMGATLIQNNGDIQRHTDTNQEPGGKYISNYDATGYREHQKMKHQMSLDPNMKFDPNRVKLPRKDRKRLERCTEVLDQPDIPQEEKSHLKDETNNNRNSYPEMNDSSNSESPQNSVDLHSFHFETLLEGKETDILVDSFQSDGAIHSVHSEPMLHPDLASNLGISQKPSTSSLYSNTSTDTYDSAKSRSASYENFRTNYSDSGSLGSQGDIQIKVEQLSPDGIRTQEQKQMADQTLKYYMNQEVKMRGKNEGSAKKPPVVPARAPEASPIWKRKCATNGGPGAVTPPQKTLEPKRMSNISEMSEADSLDGRCSSSPSSENVSLGGDSNVGYQKRMRLSMTPDHQHVMPKTADKHRKRTYRIGLNLFNKKPEKGVKFLCEYGFIDESPHVVARFLITRKGLSKQMIGEYLGNLQNEFNMEVLHYFAQEIDLAGLQVDMALRKYQACFRMPGEAQKIERLMEAFASRYCVCNPDQVKNFKNLDVVFLLAFAIIMLNTDLHNSNIKAERRMKVEDFIKNLRGIDDGDDVDRDMLVGIYERISHSELRPGVDHVTQVMKVEQTIVGKRPQLALSHRRLVCYCRLYEVHDPQKKEKVGLHQREVFLFNDIIFVTKIFSKKKTGITYAFKQSFSLCGMQVFLFETPHYQYGVRLNNSLDGKVFMTFNARNDHDRQKFVEDLKEAILESNGMEQYRIEEELQRHRAKNNTIDRHYANDDSRVLMYELSKPSDPTLNRLSAPECGGLKKLPLSNSLTDLCEAPGMRRGSSGGSLDSGVASGSSGGVNSSGESLGTQNLQRSPASRAVYLTPPENRGVRPRHPKTSAVYLQGRSSVPEGTEV
ncbi:IQ motif and SEC7 domain-containing protein 1-like isoform X4 [Mizuhopecten yessoensis]|uniref:IQ motif and SEC7 domain-containing protein 1-like isoform X4 n=1 Tax=Mizuhopecten yessoensis TaxID=6573 RepID=UPI000B4576BE|nr:IQ motif and SEC7 domain-containing protein 1-like isoform X4 [Mizuhopecten yessoensis]